MPRALLIANPRARRAGPDVVRAVVATLEGAGWTVDPHEASEVAGIRSLAAGGVAAGVDLVVAIGGDGTLIEALTPLVGTGVPFGIVPGGTGNLLAGSLGIPRSVAGAARTLVAGRQRCIDLGRADWASASRHFAIALGVGFDARVMAATHPTHKRRWGKLAYFATAASLAPRLGAVPLVVTVDGLRREFRAAEVLVANAGELLPGLVRPRLRILPDDGLLDVIVVAASGPLDGLRGAWEALAQPALGEHAGGRVFRTQGRDVEIEAEPAEPVELDGDPHGTTPVRATLLPQAISIVVPA